MDAVVVYCERCGCNAAGPCICAEDCPAHAQVWCREHGPECPYDCIR